MNRVPDGLRPLGGLSVVVTRSAATVEEFTALLEQAGASVITVPVITTGVASDGGDGLRRALAGLVDGDIVAFTSAHGARAVLESGLGDPVASVTVAAVGPATAAVLDGSKWRPSIVASRHTARDLARTIGPPSVDQGRSGRVLYPAAAEARPDLAESLRSLGWTVDQVEAYRTVLVAPEPELVLAASGADVMTFTSGSTVRGWMAVVGERRTPPIVSIGPSTTQTAVEFGLHVDVEASQQSLSGMVEAIGRVSFS